MTDLSTCRVVRGRGKKSTPLIEPAPPPCNQCRHNTTAGVSLVCIRSSLFCVPHHHPVPLPCHAPGHLASACPVVLSSAGPEPGIFPRGALEPRVSAPRSSGRHRTGLPQLGALSAAVPRNYWAPQLSKGPHCALVSVYSQRIKLNATLKSFKSVEKRELQHDKLGLRVKGGAGDTSSPQTRLCAVF